MMGQSPLRRVPAARQDDAASIRSQILFGRRRRNAHRDAEQDSARQEAREEDQHGISRCDEVSRKPRKASAMRRTALAAAALGAPL